MAEDNAKLKAKITDLEGRSRRCNVRLIGTKDMVIRAARRKQDGLKYDGKSVYLHDDYCPEVMDQRAEYREVMRQPFTLKLKPALLYPARLFIKADDGERRRLFSVKEAQQF
ncbi:hypothetical protein DPEC_G00017610 [Dallia pectoralis]|uniref:Uncharacterized protein n=1 Tax=Dallia pectoralis TaxID=75939 RepID=A0ACC2HFI4_DALPE|nr:hypothetical protein DPEC_G00017610 [Dallia pectoralis]